MKSKKPLIIIITIFCGLAIICSKPFFYSFRNTDTILNRIGYRLYEFNNIYIDVSEELNINDFRVQQENQIVFLNGEQMGKMHQDYGHTILSTYYKNRIISEIGHFKFNNWHTHDYAFNISTNDNQATIDFEIIGPDANNDVFQKRYIYSSTGKLEEIEFLNSSGELYNQKIFD